MEGSKRKLEVEMKKSFVGAELRVRPFFEGIANKYKKYLILR